jgi:hypothetical protein
MFWFWMSCQSFGGASPQHAVTSDYPAQRVTAPTSVWTCRDKQNMSISDSLFMQLAPVSFQIDILKFI